MSDVLLVYFTTCCRSMAWFYLQKVLNHLGGKISKINVLHWWFLQIHMLSHTSININWAIQQVSMLCKHNMPLKYEQAFGIGSMRFYNVRYAEKPALLLMDNASGNFEEFQREKLWCSFSSQCNKLETAVWFGSFFCC